MKGTKVLTLGAGRYVAVLLLVGWSINFYTTRGRPVAYQLAESQSLACYTTR